MKLNFIIICDNAYTDEAGRLNIIQSFDIIKTRGFPAIHPRISIVTKWDFAEGDDKKADHKQKLIIIEEKTGKEIAKTPEKALRAKSGKDKSLQFINNITGLGFNQEGNYKIQAYMDGEKAEKEAVLEVKLEGS